MTMDFKKLLESINRHLAPTNPKAKIREPIKPKAKLPSSPHNHLSHVRTDVFKLVLTYDSVL